jgi:hypothetical protein
MLLGTFLEERRVHEVKGLRRSHSLGVLSHNLYLPKANTLSKA